jgi:murein DD-endopeptidase MepM/ murein hydrolase activator NlpD
VVVAAARRRASGVLAQVCLLAVLAAGCGTPASGEQPGHRTSLRTDDLPAPRRMTPDGPRVVLAPAHAEPDLVDERPPPPAASASIPAPGTHRVAAGETLYRIARGLGTTPAALAEMNGISVSTPLAVGQVLIVPAGKGAAPAPPPPGRSEEARGEAASGDSHVLPPELAAAFETAGKPAGALRPSGASGVEASRPTGSEEPVVPQRSTARDDAAASGRSGPAAGREGRVSGRIESSVLGAVPPSQVGKAPVASVRRGAGQLQWPLRGVLYARFGRKGKSPHDGIDLAAPAGTPVRTAGEGSVLFAGPQQGYGLLVIIEHAHGLVTVYAHNRDLRVRTGQQVRESQVIATVGESGKTSGPHLHFEVRQDGAPVDPLGFLGPPPSS